MNFKKYILLVLVIFLNGKIAHAQQKSLDLDTYAITLTRQIPTTVNGWVDIGNFNVLNGAHTHHIALTSSNVSFSVAKTYELSIKYNQDSNTWRIVLPLTDSGNFSNNDFELNARVSNNIIYYRIRRTSGTTSGLLWVTLETFGSKDETFTETTATGTDTATLLPLTVLDACPEPMTRAALMALRTSNSLNTKCHYVITDPEPNGTLTAQSIILHAVDANTLSMQAGIKTSYDNTAWQGVYDIDANDVLEVTDNLENKVISNNSIITFPFGVGAVNGNTVFSKGNLVYTAGNFINNTIDSDATVTVVNGNVNRNHFKSFSNTTVNSGDFRDNEIGGDATVISSTTGDIDFNIFGNFSNSTFSGTCNFDNSVVNTDANVTMTGGNVVSCKFEQESAYIMSGGILRRSTIGQDADVTIIGQDNYDNVFGASTIYTQVGTGYIRYSTIEGTTSWINGNTNVSNVQSYVSTVNTTGSSGTISNSTLNRLIATNMQNIPSLTITDCALSDYATISATGASRLYMYRCNISGGGRLLVSASRRLDMSYTDIDSYGYIQVTNGVLTANYTKISSYGYIQHTSTGTNNVDRSNVTSQSNFRFMGTTTGCQIYYSTASDGSTIYHTGNSKNCYIYYNNANGNSSVYSNNSVNARMYYNTAQRGVIYSQGNTATHYIYYCNANSAGQIQMINNTGQVRMYSISSSSQSIARLQNTSVNANWYYSDVDSYFYALITFTTAVTRSGFFGKGRLTKTVTNPITTTPILANSYLTNIL